MKPIARLVALLFSIRCDLAIVRGTPPFTEPTFELDRN
jgi:hypothetical protein